MKLRIKDNTVRIRLSQTEVKLLSQNGFVKSECFFPGNTKLSYGISRADKWSIRFADGNIELEVPSEILQNFFNPDRIGFDHRLENDQPEGMFILIEKDFQCLTDRPHEDESDLFPNPESNC